jgi:gluconokinase
MKYIIGVDIGTSGTKAVAFSLTGKVIADAQISYSPLIPKPGFHELDPSTLLQAVINTLKEVLGKTKSTEGLSGISFSCAMHSLIAVDKNDLPLTNAITWADTRSKNSAAKIKNTAAGNRIYEHTGTPIHSMSPLCKIIWLKENEPEVFSSTKKFIGIKEYIWFQFFGKYEIDYSIASATGLFDIYNFNWFDESLALANINASHLSESKPATYFQTVINEKFKTELNLFDNIPFIIGASDGCLANLGSNAVNEGDASLTIGTSAALRMMSVKPKHDLKQRIFNYILTEDMYVSGGAVNNGAVVLQWFVENFINKSSGTSKNFSEIIDEAKIISAGSDGLLFLPYLLGERAPIWNEDARGVFFGINTKHAQQHFTRSVIEGISFSLLQVGVSLEEAIGTINNIYVSGGFIQSEFWLQMIADVFNKKVFVTNSADASAIGAAFIGFLATGLINDLEDVKKIIGINKTFEPDINKHKIYQKYFSIFISLYDKLKDEFTQLNIIQSQTNSLQ